jgi:hypothetical protein
MEIISRAQFLDGLNSNWKTYIERFQRLPPEQQAAFLGRQGYRSFADLLAHIVSWWQDAVQVIHRMRQNPALPLADYNVDAFNARAVEKFSALSEGEVLQAYRVQCQAMIDLVTHLPEDALLQPNINTRLYYEILAHGKEHPLE